MPSSGRNARLFPPVEFYDTPLSDVTPPVGYQYESPEESIYYSPRSDHRSQSSHSYGSTPLRDITPPHGYQYESPDESSNYSPERVSPYRHGILHSGLRSQSPERVSSYRHRTFHSDRRPQPQHSFGFTPLSEISPPVGYQPESPDESTSYSVPDRHQRLYSYGSTPLSEMTPPAGYQYGSPDESYENMYSSQSSDSPDPLSEISFTKTIVLTSPRRAEPVVVNIDIGPQPITDTENGERFVYNTALNVQSGGSGMLPSPLVPTRKAIEGAIPPQPAKVDPRIIKRRRRMTSRYNAPIPRSTDLYTPKVPQRNIWEKKRILGRRPVSDPFSPAYFSDNARSPETSQLTSAPHVSNRSIPWEGTPPRAGPRAPVRLSPWKTRLLDRFQPPPSARM